MYSRLLKKLFKIILSVLPKDSSIYIFFLSLHFPLYCHVSFVKHSILMNKLVNLNFLKSITVELQWLEHLWDYENLFETGLVRANEG